MTDYIEQAIERVESVAEEPMGLDAFIEQVLDDPLRGCSGAQYLVAAIEHFGTRTVIEAGQEVERYRFFDDPANGGEHAVLGHTELLNDFVEDLRQQANGSANEEKIFWFRGPTATGKSELKRCLVNGIRAFSQTDEGARYTVEWNAETGEGMDDVRYIDSDEQESSVSEEDWFQSPVQANPLTVLPEETRLDVMQEAGIANAEEYAHTGPDPFSQESMDIITQEYGYGADAYEELYSDDHLRVVRYEMDVGQGIGVLQSEDDGKPRQKLVGQWMPGMVKELDSRGRRNPHAFSYDGVISQGNAGLTVVEDARHHFDMLTKMLNVVDDDVAKIDRRNRLPVDSVFVIISNLALQSQMAGSKLGDDTLKALRRRMSSYDMSYLVTLSNEVELLYRLLTGENTVWEDPDDEQLAQRIDVNGTELARHTLYAMAMLEVVTRLDMDTNTIPDTTAIERARLYENGEIEMNGKLVEMTDLPANYEVEGNEGIPCTYTRDVIADMIAEQDVITPSEAIIELQERTDSVALFSDGELEDIREVYEDVALHVVERQEDDVLDAMLRDEAATEDEMREYVQHVYSWGTSEEQVDPDPMLMKVVEINHLGMSESDYDGTEPTKHVDEFRHDEIINGITTWIYNNADDGWDIEDGLPIREIPVIADLLDENGWDDVERVYPDVEFAQWADPLDGTATDELKEKTITNMQELYDYSDESARKVASRVIAKYQIESASTGSVLDNVTKRGKLGEIDGA